MSERMLTPRRGLALAVCLFLLFLLLRHTSSPPSHPAFGSARSSLVGKGLGASGDAAERSHGAESPFLSSSDPTSNDHVRSDTSARIEEPIKGQNQVPLNDISRKPLRNRLSYHFPYTPSTQTSFPNFIWQTWKYTPASEAFREEYRPFEASWSLMHPGYIHEVVTDNTALNILRHLYSSVPEVVSAYEALPRPVLKADFFRYLILLARGGIYTDIDTMALKAANEWIPESVPNESYGLVIGIEADPDRPDWADWYSRRIQFCQWTIQAKPGHPVLLEIVARITEKTMRRKQEGTLDQDDVHGVVDFTGPAVWTDTIFDFFNDPLYFDMSESKVNVTWRQFTGITSGKKIGDVIVLPITAFSPGIETMGAGEDEDPMAMVKHYFDGAYSHHCFTISL